MKGANTTRARTGSGTMRLKTLTLATTALLLSAGIASAATVTNDLNLRRAPGTRYGVIDTLPAGADVNVIGCTGNWCRVDWQGEVGYASASYLGVAVRSTPRSRRFMWHRHRCSALASALAVGTIGTADGTAITAGTTTINRVGRRPLGLMLSGRSAPAIAQAATGLAARTRGARPS